jgi:hypothetical protein
MQKHWGTAEEDVQNVCSNFNKSAQYKEEEKLEATPRWWYAYNEFDDWGGGKLITKNVKEKTYTIDKEFMGKRVLVKDFVQFKMENGSEPEL